MAPTSGSARRKDQDREPSRSTRPIAPAAGGESDLHEFPAVADWRDTASLPRMSRDLLEEASGITIPSSNFVMRVILAYLLAVVPAQLADLPLRAQQARMGLDRRPPGRPRLRHRRRASGRARHGLRHGGRRDRSPGDFNGDYPRAHLTRLVSLYTTGRSHFAVSYPNNPTALALPLDNGRSIRGEEISSSVWQSSPVPALVNFTVQPRSLAMFRAEEMLTLGGAIRVAETAGKRQVVNESELELRDAVLVESTGPGKRQERLLGTIKPGASVEIEARRPARSRLPRVERRAGAGPESVPGRAAIDLGRPRGKPGRAPAGRLGLNDRRRPGDRTAGRPQARVHRGAGPPAQRPAAQPRRQALQSAGHGKRRRRPAGWRASRARKIRRPPSKSNVSRSSMRQSPKTGTPAKGAPSG